MKRISWPRSARWRSLDRPRCAPPVGVVGCGCGWGCASATDAHLGVCALVSNRLNVGASPLSGTMLIDYRGDCCCGHASSVVLVTTASITGCAPPAGCVVTTWLEPHVGSPVVAPAFLRWLLAQGSAHHSRFRLTDGTKPAIFLHLSLWLMFRRYPVCYGVFCLADSWCNQRCYVCTMPTVDILSCHLYCLYTETHNSIRHSCRYRRTSSYR